MIKPEFSSIELHASRYDGPSESLLADLIETSERMMHKRISEHQIEFHLRFAKVCYDTIERTNRYFEMHPDEATSDLIDAVNLELLKERERMKQSELLPALAYEKGWHEERVIAMKEWYKLYMYPSAA